MARLLRNNDIDGSILLDIQVYNQGVNQYADTNLRTKNLDMPLYKNPELPHIKAFLSQESLAKWLDPAMDTYLTNTGLSFWLCVDNGTFFLLAVPGSKSEGSSIPVAAPFLADEGAPVGHHINQLESYTVQARNNQYETIKNSTITSFTFDAAALANLAGINQSVVTDIMIHLIFIKDEKSQLDCLTLALKIDETKAYAGVPCPPVCYYG